ncbi:CHAT domain-containing protein [aff. Roholtiella sp. LEGE 12411]|uniref:CHAT domain-containing protein n=1 Tax=aff. Roholtiella sp. LEGE 12411 TaxID=1828822 RepID=UPI00188040EF|nr:tetratricopeptide repeat protein [aff. Roholtiella sp. LEGE 12411]MBE9033840.1 tetratricopeptide repeat protein [aff. Roholtiella sp. LEGE 12411]
MLRRLLHWLNRYWRRPFGSKQTRSLKGARRHKVVRPLPELTNADLEQLFAQLLEGVHQERGQQWVLSYLRQVENRVPAERWINWLQMFGETLVNSRTPNHQLATRMVQLGELDVGKIGDLAYDIGTRLLMQNLPTENLLPIDYEDNKVQTDEETLSTSPGQELIRSLGEQLWEYDDEIAETVAPALENADVEERLTDNLEEIRGESEEVDTQIAEPAGFLLPTQEDSITNLGELRWGYEEEVAPTPKSSARSANIITPTEATSDNSLVNLELDVAYALDELWVRLDESTNLVQKLASNLAIQTGNTPSIIEQQTYQSNAVTSDQSWFYQGLQQAKTGDLLGAIASYDKAIELQPNNHEYWFNRALTLFHLERFTEALAAYERAIELKPNFYKAWHKHGGTLGELGNFEQAIASFDQAIQIKPDYPEAWSSRGLALLKLGWLKEAIASYDQALNLQPEDQENWYYRGIALAVGEQYEQAIASYDKALEIQPEFHEVWIDRGVVLFNLGKWSEAIASWDRALSDQPDFYLAWYNRGIALDNLGHREEAIASYGQAIHIKPDFHLAWYNQAIALFHLEQFTEAIACYDKALQIKQDYWEAWIGRGTAAGYLVNTDALVSESTALQQGGYEGKLASYEEGLKHLRPDTHPEGWGRLHLAIGNTYYDQGKKNPKPRNDWRKAVAEYHQALLTLTSEDFALLHLEVLQSLSKVLVGLGQTTQVPELQQRGKDLLQQLLSEATRSDETKKQLALKFSGFSQLAVDLAVESGDLVEAWEMAEQGKNACLNWLLFGWSDEISSLHYGAVQQLLNPTTAIVYWHISPAALHTFILKDGAPSPILLFTPIQDVGTISSGEATVRLNELPLPEAVRRLVEFEDWLEDWHQQYQEYSTAEDKESKGKHSWRVEMEQRLLHLKKILNISTIVQELEGITQLILILHRDLHRLPIHALFNLSFLSQEELPNVESNFTITYLPSAKVGLSIETRDIIPWNHQLLLSVEYPNSAGYPPLKFAKLESEIVSQMFNNPQRLQEKQATKSFVENALLNDYNIFHFTGHVTNNFSEPKKSQLALADEDKLTLEEIRQKNLASFNLVTLSACENVSTTSHNISTEYVSLVSSFMSGGVPHILSTLWTIESSASALVIIEFYRRLQPKKSAVTALDEATIWLKELTAGELTKWYEDLLDNLQVEELRIKAYLATQLYRSSKMVSDKKLYNHPYYWAAFTITGKPN